ncbi:uncharacterized protein I303_106869 [Kwoniella dejecticola CBS 10117]|uniref:Uncharacterized protein n=1 Tax=Kwoniella dejecticola CBS 10117 TaxID=1296121 RepID=A0A1A5ZTG3_9TREE|nr:uncharacterized protein I303_08491 [Kwoniella dejecticola CBS 10117]OBR81109.1 hypothetical protein I303_08491 [Kwoniella dejecticola CBS 10117]
MSTTSLSRVRSSHPAPIKSRWALLSYSLSSPLPYPPVFHILSILFGILALAIIALWAAATAGFETTTVFDTNYTRIDDRHWYTPLLPDSVVNGQSGELCDAAILNIGSTFRTNAITKIFPYTITAYGSGGIFEVDSTDTPNNTITEYRGSTLEDCVIAGVETIVKTGPSSIYMLARLALPAPPKGYPL